MSQFYAREALGVKTWDLYDGNKCLRRERLNNCSASVVMRKQKMPEPK
ncbi:MAG: hypothetical protein U0T82_05540 [Bacteroidales bacterium]